MPSEPVGQPLSDASEWQLYCNAVTHICWFPDEPLRLLLFLKHSLHVQL